MATFNRIRSLINPNVIFDQSQLRFGRFTRKLTSLSAFSAFLSILAIVLTLPIGAQSVATDASAIAGSNSPANLIRWTGSLPQETGRTVDLTFAIYQNPTGGLALWNETQTVKVGADGRYTVLLGATLSEGLPQTLFQSGEARWIEAQTATSPAGNVTADAVNATQPARILLAAVPYAFESADAETLGGRAASDYVTREDLQSTVVNQVQALTIVGKSLSTIASPLPVVGTPLPIVGTSSTGGSALSGAGTSGFLPAWTASAQLGNSMIAESGTNVGIGTNTPATMLDVNGASTLRGAVSLLATTASIAAGVNSPVLQLSASTYSSTGKAAIPQNFVWQAASLGNNTSSPTANLALLFGSGTTSPAPTGLSIAPSGQITFAPGQTFPGTGGGTLTGITAGTGLSGGGSNGNVTLALSGPITTANGGTGATTAAAGRANLGAAASGANSDITSLSGMTAPLSVAQGGTGSKTSATALANLNGSVTQYPEWYGAVGNGIHDDTAAIQAAFAALPTAGGTVHLAAKFYLITGMIDIAGTASGIQRTLRSLTGEGTATVINCNPSSALTACVRDLNGSRSTIKDLTITANSNVSYVLDVTTLPNSTENVNISNLNISGGINGVAIGPDTNNDVSHVIMDDVIVKGASNAGFILGNGAQGNVLDNYCFGCDSEENAIGVLIQGAGIGWYGGSVEHNTTADFEMSRPPDQNVVIEGVRSETSNRFWLGNSTTSSAIGAVSIRDVVVSSFTASDNCVLTNTGATPISVENSRFDNSGSTTFCVNATATNPMPFSLINVGTDNPSMPSILLALSKKSGISLYSVNDYYLSGTSMASSPGSGKMFFSGSAVFNGTVSAGSSSVSAATNGVIVSGTAQSASISGVPTYMPGAHVASCKQAGGYTNSSARGELVIQGGTAAEGTICTVTFSSASGAAPVLCTVWQNGGSKEFNLGHGAPSTAGFTITAGSSVAGSTVIADYYCQP